MREATVLYPDDLLEVLELSEDQLREELVLVAAAELYETGRLSAGQAARLARLERVTFLEQLRRVGSPAINLRDEELEAEIREAKELAASGPPTPAR